MSCFFNVICVFLIFDFSNEWYFRLCGTCHRCFILLPICCMRQKIKHEMQLRSRQSQVSLGNSNSTIGKNSNNNNNNNQKMSRQTRNQFHNHYGTDTIANNIYYDVFHEDSLI